MNHLRLSCALSILFVHTLSSTFAHGATTIVTGRITNPVEDSIAIDNVKAPVNADGDFRVALDIAEADYLTLSHGGAVALFLSPGDSLAVSFDAWDFYFTVEFGGQGAAANEYLSDLSYRMEQHERIFNYAYRRIFALDETGFIAATDSIRAEFIGPLEAFLAQHPELAETPFARFERTRIDCRWADYRLSYPNVHGRVTGEWGVNLGDNYYSYLNELPLADPALLDFDPYTDFIDNLLTTRARQRMHSNSELKKQDNQLTRAKYTLATELFRDPDVRCHWLSTIMGQQIEDFGPIGIDDLMTSLGSTCHSNRTGAVQKLYDTALAEFDGVDWKIYKEAGPHQLRAYIFQPEDAQPDDKRAAIVIFHGAGWAMGRPAWCFPSCRRWADKGLVAVAAQYRLTDRHGVTPIEQIGDAKSIFRWLRANADRLGIDPNRIIGEGWSAGGHLVTAAAMIDEFDDPQDDLSISGSPDALMLLFPAVKIYGDQWFTSLLRGRADPQACSPANFVRPGLPPTVIFQGTADNEVPYAGVAQFAKDMQDAGNQCVLHSFEGRPHLFTHDPEDRAEVIRLENEFVESLGYLE